MIYSTTLTRKGQVTIPVALRRRLQLKPGESVRFRWAEHNQVILEKHNWKQALDKLHRKIASHLKQLGRRPLSDDQLNVAINTAAQQMAEERYKQSLTKA